MQGGEGGGTWSEAEWAARDAALRRRTLAAANDDAAWAQLVRGARSVMRAYTTSFFIVSRFLPARKRDAVEAVYASVRYPDEVVDTFPLDADARTARLDAWAAAYEEALDRPLRRNLAEGVPCFLAGFVHVADRTGIPSDHYRAFLGAMRRDIRPEPFATLDALIDDYVYGSATVVGYFLTHVYGSATPEAFPAALEAARDLGIGLQLTNFVRDVAEDHRRGRCYLPMDALRAEGIDAPDPGDPSQREGLVRVIRALAEEAAARYARAGQALDAFAPDCRVAMRACIRVYGRLNARILAGDGYPGPRASVPFREKWHALPASKYWRIPLAALVP